jgi:hypothetical protein
MIVQHLARIAASAVLDRGWMGPRHVVRDDVSSTPATDLGTTCNEFSLRLQTEWHDTLREPAEGACDVAVQAQGHAPSVVACPTRRTSEKKRREHRVNKACMRAQQGKNSRHQWSPRTRVRRGQVVLTRVQVAGCDDKIRKEQNQLRVSMTRGWDPDSGREAVQNS